MIGLATLVACLVGLAHRGATAADDGPELAAIRAAAEKFVKDFNSGKAAALAAHFATQGELIDEEGQIFQGRDELEKLFAAYFAKFPGAELALEIESIRVVGGNIAIEEGTRYLSTKEAAKAQVRYVAVRAKTEGQWLIASIREFYDEPAPTPNDQLQPLAWLVGEWISEDADAAVKIVYRWSDDKNFLLGDFQATHRGQPVMNSTQRIGWDPVAGKVRSWLFDADGGFAEGSWTPVEEGWVIKSTATAPDGGTGSATVTISRLGKDSFKLTGTERVTHAGRQDDFEVTVTRRPPAPAAQAEADPGASAPPANRSLPKAVAPKLKTKSAPLLPKR
jgi:uncharacterized protein (TIGR02246 family)